VYGSQLIFSTMEQFHSMKTAPLTDVKM